MWAKPGAKSKFPKNSQAEQTFTGLTFRVSYPRLIANVCAGYFYTDV